MLDRGPDHVHEMFIGREVVTADGHKVGVAGRVILNRITDVPEWLVVESGLFGRDHHIVPIAGSDISNSIILLACKRDAIENAPNGLEEGELPADAEDALNRHYGLGAVQ